MAESESKDPASAWGRFLDRHGWPTLLLFLVGCSMVRIWFWIEPKLDLAFAKHFQFVDDTKKVQAEQAESSKQQAENGKQLAVQMSKQTEILERQNSRSEGMERDIKEIHRAVIKP